MDEVGLAVVNLCNVIPDGVVCFFASFSYLEQVYKRWSSAESGSILNRLSKRKKIFKEPRDSGQVESTLRDYATEIEVGIYMHTYIYILWQAICIIKITIFPFLFLLV